MATLLPSEANSIVRDLTNGHMHVEATDKAVYLVHDGKHERICLLPYQLTEDGLDAAVAELWAPQNA